VSPATIISDQRVLNMGEAAGLLKATNVMRKDGPSGVREISLYTTLITAGSNCSRPVSRKNSCTVATTSFRQ